MIIPLLSRRSRGKPKQSTFGKAVAPPQEATVHTEEGTRGVSLNLEETSSADRLLGLDEVKQRTSLSKSHIYRLMSRGQFPDRRKVGRRRVGWLLSEVQKWIATRPVKGRGDHA